MKQRSETSGTVGRRDLAKAIATGNQETVNAVVSMLGLELLHLESVPQPDTEGILFERTAPAPSALPLLVDSTSYPGKIEDIAIWRCVSYSERAPFVKPDSGDTRHEWHVEENAKPASHRLLAGWNEIGPRIRAILTDIRRGKNPDLPKLVRQVASRQLIIDIPRQKKRHWGTEVHIIRDTSTRLSSFRPDQEDVIRQIQAMLPEAKVNLAHGASPAALWSIPKGRFTTEQQELRFGTPPNPSTILVLGDLGCLSRDSDSWRSWLHWGQYQGRQGHLLLALVPCGSKRIVHALHDIYSVQTWQADKWSVDDPAIREDLLRQILVLAAPTLRLEPGLLRDLRELIPAASDASLEVDAWNSEYMAGVHPDAATIDRDLAQTTLLPEFERLPIELRRQAILCIRNWRLKYQQQPELWFAELLSLSPESRCLLPQQQDLYDAKASSRQLFREWRTSTTSTRSKRVRVWMYNTTDLLSDHAYEDPDVGWLLRQTRRELHDEPNSVLPGTDLRELPTQSLNRFRIDVADESISLTHASGSTGITLPSSAWIRASVPEIEVAPEKVLRGSAFWKAGKPDFVSQYGTDEFGAWLEFNVPRKKGGNFVVQRMRWIRPGTFLMGSPQDERDRDSDETQHEVKLSRGFWLADTACTQELWEAVTGKTPSRFKGDRLPVEQVSYDEVIRFVSALTKLVPELAPALPTEAQWEYACRAGTTTPFSFGDTISTDQVNFDGTHPYGDSPKGEYRRETVEVKSLPANRWGLYEMHGNVWEWCSDWYREYSPELQVDPSGPATGSARVMRGGSWFYSARSVRSACRSWRDPGYRYEYLGFRLLSSASAEPTEAAEVPVAEQGSEQTRFGVADEIFLGKSINVDEGTTAEVEFKSLGPIRIRSNLEEVVLERMTKPQWAVEYGRDLFGTYADFEIPSAANSPPVCQRMRWIPPGQFQMGSPTDETERFDNELLHHVTISTGFWMFDTPCTQALWLALMPGENPSYFPDLQRPVEQVDWVQAQAFAAELTTMIPELSFSLPTEAQWEYACRAGTSTAIYTGPLEILGDANAPALDEIAWYGGNSGHEFDHERAVDVSSFTWLSEKQYPFKSAGTRQVKQKRPNPYGLYDMLGNVWEWCHDWHGDYPSESDVDPMGPETGSYRVVRGGGWSNDARSVRSACRHWCDPGVRYKFLGFRLLSSASPDRNQRPNK